MVARLPCIATVIATAPTPVAARMETVLAVNLVTAALVPVDRKRVGLALTAKCTAKEIAPTEIAVLVPVVLKAVVLAPVANRVATTLVPMEIAALVPVVLKAVALAPVVKHIATVVVPMASTEIVARVPMVLREAVPVQMDRLKADRAQMLRAQRFRGPRRDFQRHPPALPHLFATNPDN